MFFRTLWIYLKNLEGLTWERSSERAYDEVFGGWKLHKLTSSGAVSVDEARDLCGLDPHEGFAQGGVFEPGVHGWGMGI